jgi:RNA polymerase sigma factor (sigma-70 family)
MTAPLLHVTTPADDDLAEPATKPEPVQGPTSVDRSEIAVFVKGAAAGDQAAWDALVDRFGPTVWAIARAHRLNPSDAADVSQTTWLRLVENLHRIEQPERVGAWLATTARRESLRVLRLASRQTPTGDDFDMLPDPVPVRPPEHTITAQERAVLVNKLVDQLPTRSQVLLRLLSADSPLSYRDISEALGMPIGSIGPTRARALEQLQRLAVRAGVKPEDVFG